MKVENIRDISKFFEVIDQCTGRVELVTGEGDRLNLTSTLSQYVFCSIASHPDCWADSTITCKTPEDYALLADYLYEKDV